MYCESTEFFFIKLHTFLLYGDIVSALGPEILIQEPAIHNLGRGPHEHYNHAFSCYRIYFFMYRRRISMVPYTGILNI